MLASIGARSGLELGEIFETWPRIATPILDVCVVE
jgi:hypothetical protein